MPDIQDEARTRRERRRQRKAASIRGHQAYQAAQAQAEAEARRRRYRTRRRRRVAAWALFALAAVVAITHILEHAGAFQVMSPGLEDLLIGYPSAMLVAVAGGIVLGRA